MAAYQRRVDAILPPTHTKQKTMICESLTYTTLGNLRVTRSTSQVKMDTALDEILFHLNQVLGGLLTSSYESGRYKRWAIGFINPP